MVTPQQKFADALDMLRTLQDCNRVAIRSDDLSRPQRELLMKQSFLQEVMKGWYIPARPDAGAGESTAWYTSYWGFCSAYLNKRFGEDWSLSPELSIALQTGNRTVPKQLLVRTPKGNKPTGLPLGTPLFDVRAAIPASEDVGVQDGLRPFSIPAAPIASAPGLYENNAIDARAALATVRDASELLGRLLQGGHSAIAGRLAGAFRNIGRERIADDILKAMRSAGYSAREQNPFATKLETLVPARERSPYAGRIRLMWQEMRRVVLERFPPPPGPAPISSAYRTATSPTPIIRCRSSAIASARN